MHVEINTVTVYILHIQLLFVDILSHVPYVTYSSQIPHLSVSGMSSEILVLDILTPRECVFISLHILGDKFIECGSYLLL